MAQKWQYAGWSFTEIIHKNIEYIFCEEGELLFKRPSVLELDVSKDAPKARQVDSTEGEHKPCLSSGKKSWSRSKRVIVEILLRCMKALDVGMFLAGNLTEWLNRKQSTVKDFYTQDWCVHPQCTSNLKLILWLHQFYETKKHDCYALSKINLSSIKAIKMAAWLKKGKWTHNGYFYVMAG